MTQKLKAMIVDDEPLARLRMRSLLEAHGEIQLMGEADSIDAATTVLEETKPEVVFLDIHLHGESGFELLPHLGEKMHIIFVTAYDEYAVRAFEANALDYLLKPVSRQRLKQTVQRLVSRVSNHETPDPHLSPLAYDDHVFVRHGSICRFIRVDHILCIQSQGSYAEVRTKEGASALTMRSLKQWEETLDKKHFLRIHRSYLINLNYAQRVEKRSQGHYQIFMTGMEAPLDVSRRYAAKLLNRAI